MVPSWWLTKFIGKVTLEILKAVGTRGTSINAVLSDCDGNKLQSACLYHARRRVHGGECLGSERASELRLLCPIYVLLRSDRSKMRLVPWLVLEAVLSEKNFK